MDRSHSFFFGVALVAGAYLLFQTATAFGQRQIVAGSPVAQQGTQGGHYMPDGTWMAGSMNGMGCAMNRGGGCGCAGMGAR